MGINSCLYEVKVVHHRSKPKKHTLSSKIFMFALDLDEMDTLERKFKLFGHNKARLYNFADQDHICEPGRTLKESIVRYVRAQDPSIDVFRILLLTNLRTMGYVFNPVSFYYCYDRKDEAQCVVVEIGNTFKEKKFFFISPDKRAGERFQDEKIKYFYISPFTALDDTLEFRIGLPKDRLFIAVNNLKKGERIVFATMTAYRKEWTNKNLWKYTFLYPLVTLRVIFEIHRHALILFFKKVPFSMKQDAPHLQKEFFCAWTRK